MICWPFFAEQETNSRYCCTEWGIGLEIDSDVKREQVETLVRELMDGEKGNQMNEMAMEWKKIAHLPILHVGFHSSTWTESSNRCFCDLSLLLKVLEHLQQGYLK